MSTGATRSFVLVADVTLPSVLCVEHQVKDIEIETRGGQVRVQYSSTTHRPVSTTEFLEPASRIRESPHGKSRSSSEHGMLVTADFISLVRTKNPKAAT